MNQVYVENFSSNEDIIEQYSAPTDALDDAIVYLAWYGYGNYEGSSLVVFKKDGKLYEVNGSHCSCNGLEGQWEPEETSWAALDMRDLPGYDGAEGAMEILKNLVRLHKEG
jgi:hypothetical protein